MQYNIWDTLIRFLSGNTLGTFFATQVIFKTLEREIRFLILFLIMTEGNAWNLSLLNQLFNKTNKITTTTNNEFLRTEIDFTWILAIIFELFF